jgi:hypothetical protein
MAVDLAISHRLAILAVAIVIEHGRVTLASVC